MQSPVRNETIECKSSVTTVALCLAFKLSQKQISEGSSFMTRYVNNKNTSEFNRLKETKPIECNKPDNTTAQLPPVAAPSMQVL